MNKERAEEILRLARRALEAVFFRIKEGEVPVMPYMAPLASRTAIVVTRRPLVAQITPQGRIELGARVEEYLERALAEGIPPLAAMGTLMAHEVMHIFLEGWERLEVWREAYPSWEKRVGAKGLAQVFNQAEDLVMEFKLLGPEGGDGDRGDPAWTARQARPTLEAFVRRLRASVENVGHLIRGDRPGQPPEPLKGAQIHVVDIAKLHPQGQMFVVGSILRGVFAAKERQRYQGPVFIVLDELNKYAPREGESPIKDILLDIAERGRSLGVILIGAQQTASEVERRVVGNAAIRVVGRLDAAEAERPEYRHLPPSFRARAVLLTQGSVLLAQPEIPVPLLVRFPYPAWATKRSEVLEDNSAEALRRELF